VGAVRELVARQEFDDGAKPWVVWTGGDAERLARPVSGEDARIIPDLVLRGVMRAAFPTG
jgi:type III pantothenate kinase